MSTLFFTSSRADWSRCQTVAEACGGMGCAVLVAACGSHLGKGGTVMEVRAGGFPVHELTAPPGGDSPYDMALSLARTSELTARLLRTWPPDVVVLSTDRYEQLGAATAAAMMNVPIAHIQGGEVTGSVDESVRHAVTKLAHLHFPATPRARERIVAMGEDPARVHLFGCPGTDLLLRVDVSLRDKPAPYLLCVMHPVTTEWESSYEHGSHVGRAVRAVGLPATWVAPNHDAGGFMLAAGIFAATGQEPRPHLPHREFVGLMAHAAAMVGNSSSGIREACYFGTPVVNVGSRQQGRERGKNVLDAPVDSDRIAEAVRGQVAHGPFPVERLYGDGDAGRRIAEVLVRGTLPSAQKRWCGP